MNSSVASRGQNFKWQLLTTASAFALLASLSGAQAQSMPLSLGDGSHIWVEVGGQLTDYSSNPTIDFNDPTVPGSTQFIGPSGGWDGDAKFSFQPAGSDWIFSAAVRYGRTNPKNFAAYGTITGPTTSAEQALAANAVRPQHMQHAHGAVAALATPDAQYYYSGFVSHKESHAIIDFSVGKDFGLGMFGQNGSSVLSFGIRFAQFSARTDISYYTGTKSSTNFSENARISRSFNGVGPMIAWDASAPLGGDFNSQLSIDWGADASLLFGKHKATLSATYSTGAPYSASRSKNTTVPSIGGYLALSWHGMEGTKVSLGYRADDYFNALDGGFDTAVKIDRTFYGPFVKIGISN